MSASSLAAYNATRALTTLGAPRASTSRAGTRGNALFGMPGILPTTAASSASATQSVRDPRVRAREQAVEFESVFLSSMFGQMFTGIDGDGPFGGGGAAGVWRSFLTEEYAKSFARAGGIGIADHVYRALIGQQEARTR